MQVSCGLLLYDAAAGLSVLLVHPGGPYWRGKDDGAWSIPKGLPGEGEEPLAAAIREFREETGLEPVPPFHELTPRKQKSGKLVRCWAFAGQAHAPQPGLSRFEIEWPPRSGRMQSFPEVDDVRIFSLNEALMKILPGQTPFLRELAQRLGANEP